MTRTIKDIIGDLVTGLARSAHELPELREKDAIAQADAARGVVIPLLREARDELARSGLVPELNEHRIVPFVNDRQALSLGKLTFVHPRDRGLPSPPRMGIVVGAQRGSLLGCVAIPDGESLRVVCTAPLSDIRSNVVIAVIDRLVESIRDSGTVARQVSA